MVLKNGLSRMRGDSPVRFLGEDATVTSRPYPTKSYQHLGMNAAYTLN